MYTHTYVVIVSTEPDVIQTCQQVLNSIPEMKSKIYSELSEFLAEKSDQPISGLVIDLKISMKASPQQKEELSLVESVIPILRVKKNPKNTLSGICRALSGEGNDFIFSIFKNQFTIENTRQIRLLPRKQVFLNVRLYSDSNLDISNSKKVNTVNISLGGMFVHTTDEFTPGQKIKLTLEEAKELSYISAIIRWVQAWGRSKSKLPGIGIEFENLTNEQRQFFDKEINQPWLNLEHTDGII